MSEHVASARTYHLTRPDSLGFFKRRSGKQFALGSFGVALAVIGVVARTLPTGARVAFGVVAVLIVLLAGARTLSGEDVIELVGPIGRYVGRSVARRRRFVAPLVPITASGTGALPPAFAGITIIDLDPMVTFGSPGAPLGVIHDRADGTVALALRVHGDGFLVASPDEQDYRIETWGDALAQFCREGHPVVRVTWSHWSAPAGLEEHRAWLDASCRLDPDEEMVAAYDEVLSLAGRTAARSEVLVTISVALARVKLLAEHRGDRVLAAVKRLVDEGDLFAGQLQRAGLVVSRPLPAGALARALRDRLDPSAAHRLDRLGAGLGELAGLVAPANGFPLVTEELRSAIRTDDSYHRVFRIAEWPRVPLRADWLARFLCATDVVRSCTVTLLPESRRVARRHANALATRVGATIEEKEDHGRRVGAEERRAKAAVDALDDELEGGAGMERFVGLVDVVAPNAESLDIACEEVLQAAADAHLELRRLDFRQSEALVAALPLGRGARGAWQ